jgi:branched-chain amino acid transport system permease protein
MVGALLVPVAFLEATRFIPQFGPPGFIDALQWIIVGVLALVFLWFWPRGVIPERRRRFPPTGEGEEEQRLMSARAGR